MLVPRVLTALFGMPVLLVALFAGGTVYGVIILTVAVLALLEALLLFGAGRDPETIIVALIGLAAWILGPAVGATSPSWSALAAFVAIVLARQVLRFPRVSSNQSAGMFMAAAYSGLPFAHFFLLRNLDGGIAFALMAFVLTWVFDTVAYFVGMRWGRRRLAPAISPGKTWEGAIGGTAATLTFALLPLPFWALNPGARLAAALAVIIFGQLGDLAESSIKRHAGAKDSGTLLPGHGGILDRFDSLMLALPAVYYVALLMSRGPV